MANEDWKGEHLIRARKPTREERQADGMRVINNLHHERRRQAGIPVYGWKPFFDFGTPGRGRTDTP